MADRSAAPSLAMCKQQTVKSNKHQQQLRLKNAVDMGGGGRPTATTHIYRIFIRIYHDARSCECQIHNVNVWRILHHLICDSVGFHKRSSFFTI